MNLKQETVNGIVLLAILLFLLSFFTPNLMLSKTITAGGDTASHYYPAKYLKEYLLPKGKIVGWCLGNYIGFPMFQFYFPLAFVLMVLLSYFMPLEISFKLITVLGTFLLPICTFFSLRAMKFKFPLPAIGAIFTLPFLFMEANSMWGGNIPSTLAGEFSYSLSLALTILFFGTLYQGIKENKYWLGNAILLAIITFTHVYTLLWVILSSSFLLLVKKKELVSRFTYLFKTYLLAFLLVSFWAIPLVANLPWTISYNYVWRISSLEKVLPFIFWIFLPFSIIAIFYGTYKFYRKGDDRALYLTFPIGISLLLFVIASHIGVVDIRFVPFMQISLMILAAIGFMMVFELIEKILQKFKPKAKIKALWVIPLIILLLTIFWVNNARFLAQHPNPFNWDEKTISELLKNTYHGFIPDWIKWNYSGYENKPLWNAFSSVNNFLKGNQNDPRVVYEHSPLHNSAGSLRAYENIPLFSGRSTLEGLYMQSTPTSPFVFYIQSEVSKVASCPLPGYSCSPFNLNSGTKHLEMFNVLHFIARTDKVKGALKNDSRYKLVFELSPYQIYELTTNENKYVTVPKNEPVLFSIENWKNISYEWFKRPELQDTPLVFVKDLQSYQKKFKATSSSLGTIPQIPLNENCLIQEQVANEEITFQTNCVGQPHIIKVSYYPNWKVEGASRIYLVSPSFMLVFPEKEKVKLYYGSTVSNQIGMVLSILGFIILLYFLTFSRHQKFIKFLKR